MEEENAKMKRQLERQNYEKTYRDNEMMKLELKNMYILLEENKDLRAELQTMRITDKSEAEKQLIEENTNLKRRNGLLLIENEDLKKQVDHAKKQLQTNQAFNTSVKTTAKTQEDYLNEIRRGPFGLSFNVRPQTAAIGAISKLDGFKVNDELLKEVEDEMDEELKELLERNRKNLSELHSEIREVNRAVAQDKTPTIV